MHMVWFLLGVLVAVIFGLVAVKNRHIAKAEFQRGLVIVSAQHAMPPDAPAQMYDDFADEIAADDRVLARLDNIFAAYAVLSVTGGVVAIWHIVALLR